MSVNRCRGICSLDEAVPVHMRNSILGRIGQVVRFLGAGPQMWMDLAGIATLSRARGPIQWLGDGLVQIMSPLA